MRGQRLLTVLACLTLFVACGKSTSPTTPSSVSSSTVASSSSGATISGAIVGGASTAAAGHGPSASSPAALVSTATPASVITVTVVGTAISTTVGSNGTFTLTGVPAGDIQLRFTGPGVDSTVTISSVQTTETITITVNLAGGAAAIDNETRRGGADSQIEGLVTAIPPTTAGGSFMVAGTTVQTDTNTTFDQDGTPKAFADIKVGLRVHVAGAPTSTGGFLATRVELQVEDTEPPTSPTTPEPTDASVTGAITSRTGVAPALTLVVGTKTVHTNASTKLGGGSETDAVTSREGDQSTTIDFSMLQVGVTIDAEGTLQSDGSILASRISIEGTVSTETELQGLIAGLTGTCPAITFTIGTKTVTTDASTSFGTACSTLKNGTDVEVKGTVQTNGTIKASSVKQD